MTAHNTHYEVWDDMGLVRRFSFRSSANAFAKKIGGVVKRVSAVDWDCYEPAIF